MARIRSAAVAATIVLPLSAVIAPASAAPARHPVPAAARPAPPGDVRELARTRFTLDGRAAPPARRYQPRSTAQDRAAVRTPAVGTVRQWLGLDDVKGTLDRKDYTLRAVGKTIEVWVANDLAFPAGDCRNQVTSSTRITDAQVKRLVREFDDTIYPTETRTFSTPPDRDGSHPTIGADAAGHGGVYTGAGNRTVTLVDNVRDDNYYDFPARPTYIAGFFSPQFNELFDRNVMTIDAYDWLHRTSVDPPDAPTDDLCTSRPARPHLYEGTFAHEWQHLLHYYTDPAEDTWVNEGLSDAAQSLVGYVDGNATVFDRGGDSHLYCYQGFGPVKTAHNANPRDCGGPQGSLNGWDEGGPNGVLADYGHAYQLMLFLRDRYGDDVLTRLHRDGKRQGLAGLAAALRAHGVTDLYRVLHDFQTMTLVDRAVGGRAGVMLGAAKADVTSRSVRSTVNLANPRAYDQPGAAPNGADYVRLRGTGGRPLPGADLRSVTFTGARHLPPTPLGWRIVRDDPARPGNPVLFSGNAADLDVAAVVRVTVPSTAPTLTFRARYGAEQGYDYGYVTVSTDGGRTYRAIAGNRTVAGPLGAGVTGSTSGFVRHRYDLSAFAGRSVLLGFRYVSDGAVNEGGWLIDDIAVGGRVVSDGSSLAPFHSPTELRPIPVHHWNVRLIGLDTRHARAWQLGYDGRADLALDRADLAALSAFPTVVAVVAYDEPTERLPQYAPYTLKVNGVTQPGG